MIYAQNNKKIYSYHLKLYPQLEYQFKSRTAALIIAHCEYWFSREKFKKGFYKFLEPAQIKSYIPGDSWSERLGIGRITFNKMFDRIGIRYKSKSEFMTAQSRGDPFCGKLYLSYYDRKRNQMYYERNHEYADQFLKNLFIRSSSPEVNDHVIIPTAVLTKSNDDRSSSDQKQHDLIIQKRSQTQVDNTNKNTIRHHSRNDTNYRSLNIDIQINTNNSSDSKTEKVTLVADSDKQKVGEEMKAIWLEEVGHCTLSKISQSLADRMANFLTSCLNSCLQAWRAYCRKIASSRFLMGEVKQTFKAWLPWVIKQPTFEKIESGEYTLGDRELKQTTGQQQDYEAQAEANIASQPTEEAQTFHKYLLAQAGAVKYNNWFKDLEIMKIDQQAVYLKARLKFVETYINNNYESLVMSALKKLSHDAKSFTFNKI